MDNPSEKEHVPSTSGRDQLGKQMRLEYAPNLFSTSVMSIAKKLSRLQSRSRANVVVPRRVSLAHLELVSATKVAQDVLRRTGTRAKEKLIGKLGGPAPVQGSLGGGAKKQYGISSLSLLAMAAEGPMRGLPCAEHGPEDIAIVRAAFQLDAESGYLDTRLTQKATHFIRSRRATIDAYDESLMASDIVMHERGDARNRFDKIENIIANPIRDSFPQGVPPEPGGDGLGSRTGGGFGQEDPGSPLFPPGTDLSDPSFDGDSGPCLELSDLCLDLFVGFATAALNDTDAQLIASVSPNCVCYDGYDNQTEFTAFPDPKGVFPAQRDEYRLIFRGNDITDRIKTWSTAGITFTIPEGAHTGSLYLHRFNNSVHHRIGRVLSNLCGIPEAAGVAGSLSPSSRAIITIVYRPVIDFFSIDDREVTNLPVEACRAVKLSWGVHPEDQPLGRLLPPHAFLEMEVRDAAQNVLYRSTDPVGHWYHNASQTTTYRLRVRSLIENEVCGETTSNAITVARIHYVYMEAYEPDIAEIVAGRSGMIRIRLSCPAPVGGAIVTLHSTDRNIIQLPNSVQILPGEIIALVPFSAQRIHGQVTLSARLAGHEDGQLQFKVVEFLTAIALSGGGAKGSFEVGALIYLREIWQEIRPTIICGTSVGAINAVALAETQDSGSIDKLERIWLGLQTHADMYSPTPELTLMLDNLEIEYETFINSLNNAAGGVSGFSFWNLVNEEAIGAAAVAGYLVGGPLGAIVAGATTASVDVADTLNEMGQVLENASSIFTLEPIRAALAVNVDPLRVANSGMKLRLAAVALEDGLLYYITESGQLFRNRARNPDWSEPIVDSDGLFRGVLASAAFPGLFPAPRITTTSSVQTYVDGGVREVLPSYAAVELGAQLIFNITASPIGPQPATGFTSGFKLPKIALRSIDLSVTEVVEEESLPRAGFCDGRERVLIAPSILVHGTTEIDPGLIRINMAYGFMKAFDRDQLRRGNLNVIQYYLWKSVTEEIVASRLNCHVLERRIGRYSLDNYGVFHGPAANWLRDVRNQKNRIAELIEERFDEFGVDAFPRTMASNQLGNQKALDWATNWEIHLAPVRNVLEGMDLWMPQIIDYGSVGGDGPGSPPIMETNVVSPYPFAHAMVAALQNR